MIGTQKEGKQNERSNVDYLHLCDFADTYSDFYMHLRLDNREIYVRSRMDDLISRQAAIDAADDMVEPQESEG